MAAKKKKQVMSAEKSLFPLKGQRLNVVSPEGITVGVNRMSVVADKSSLPPLYHGSGSHIKVGDTVRPHPKSPDPESRRYAFASSIQGVAGAYAGPSTIDRNGQGVFWGIVHRVGPTEDNEVLKDIHPHGERSWGKEHGHYLSKQFKVLEATHLVDYMGEHTPLGNNSPMYTPRTKKYKQLKFQDIRE